MRKLHGVVVPIATPLAAGDRVDEAGLRRLVQYLVGAGVHGLFVNGSMGGFAFLTDEQQLRAISIVVSEVDGAIPVLAGLGETSTSRALPKAKAMAREGVTHLTTLPPFYFLATQDHLKSYFLEIAAATDLPLVLYDNPVLTKCNLHPETVAELRAAAPSIVGIKVSNQDTGNLQKLLELLGGTPQFAVLSGTESGCLVGMQMGCDGFVGGLHNIYPQAAAELYEAFLEGDIERAVICQRNLVAVSELFSYGSIWGGFDEALRFLGICERATGAPYVTQLTESEKTRIHGLLAEFGLRNSNHARGLHFDGAAPPKDLNGSPRPAAGPKAP